MAGRGPLPESGEVLEARGSWRAKPPKKRSNGCVKYPSSARLETAPSDLGPAAIEIYRRTVAALRDTGLGRASDVMAIRRYSRLMARWDEADSVLREKGHLDEGAVRPEVGILDKIEPQLCRLEIALGLTPTARASLRVGANQPARPADKKPKEEKPAGGETQDPLTLVMPA